MEIQKSKHHDYISDRLDDISRAEHTCPCPHCGVPVKYPTVARASDVENFELLMESALRVMGKYNLTGNILDEIKAECLIAIAKKKR